MTGGESQYPQDWFRLADQDLERVKRRLDEGDVDDAAFRLQQAIEKYFKGYLLARGWQLRRLHDLEVLLAEAIRHDRRLERFRGLCREVAGYYLVQRYPMFEEGPSAEDVHSVYGKAKRLVRILRAGGLGMQGR